MFLVGGKTIFKVKIHPIRIWEPLLLLEQPAGRISIVSFFREYNFLPPTSIVQVRLLLKVIGTRTTTTDQVSPMTAAGEQHTWLSCCQIKITNLKPLTISQLLFIIYTRFFLLLK